MKNESSVWYETYTFRDISWDKGSYEEKKDVWVDDTSSGQDRQSPGSGWQLLVAAKKLSTLRENDQFFRLELLYKHNRKRIQGN